MSTKFCQYLGTCGGCAWGERHLEDQRGEKLTSVQKLFPAVRFLSTPALALRDRADLVWEEGRLGLYGLNSRSVVDLESCPMMTAALAEFYVEFRRLVPPGIKKGSVRLRVSPSGERGVWLDFANADVKALFDERHYLHQLSKMAFVEIGQRRKALEWKEGAPKLVDPILKPWFETYAEDFQPIPLFGPVGGFSQGGFQSNRVLVEAVTAAAGQTSIRAWTELFCGNGNFALALAARGYAVTALELEDLAVEGLKRSQADHPEWSLQAARADVYLKTGTLPSLRDQGLLVDPPRAGLRQVLSWLEQMPKLERPAALVYVSCFTEVLVAESARLQAMGYQIRSLVGVDQFAQTPHAEWVALFTF